ncbi:N-acetyltransferase [Leucothrix arctica]|uniref:N-acetyltransferase n=2 Tax=Leucothrix arctica TaxID=1481894 RepID=A0A317CFD9_9GAMM|nr:N-acetyltransferase [Leucothrix arctica]
MNGMTNKIALRDAKSDDYEFAFEAKKQAMRETIESKWGWDEAFQLALHEQRWSEKPWFIIENDGDAIGTVSLHQIDDKTLRFGEFYLLDSCRNQGIGTGVLVDTLKDCDAKGLRVILEYLHWNPVGSLYKRHGFEVTSKNEIHYFMERITPVSLG